MSAAARKSDEIQTAVLDGNGVRAALQGFFGIMDLWGVGNDEARVILGAPSQSTFFAWRRGDIRGVGSKTNFSFNHLGIPAFLRVDPSVAADRYH